jgi:hypothetical protein
MILTGYITRDKKECPLVKRSRDRAQGVRQFDGRLREEFTRELERTIREVERRGRISRDFEKGDAD